MDTPSLSYYHQIRRLCLMTNHKNGKRYSDDFRKMVVDLYNSGQSVRDLSREYGVSDVTIYACIKKLSPMELEDGSSNSIRRSEDHTSELQSRFDLVCRL